MKNYYLAYGSNLNLYAMKGRCPDARVVSKGILNNYRLVYRGSTDGYSYLTIEEAEGYKVPVGIFEVSLKDVASLDFYEGYPSLYDKKYVSVKAKWRKYKGLIYVMKDEFSYHMPSNQYIDTCEVGYEHFGFDKNILDEALAYSISNIPKQKIK